MRPIKFRGKVVLGHASNQWKEGDLIQYHMQEDQQVYNANIRNSCGIVYAINPKTLGQFTGLYDKNGNEIYEGDILRYCEKNKQIYIVKYGSYNRNADLKSTAPQYIGATFFLDGTGIGMYKKEDYEVMNPIYTYNGHAFLYPVSGDFPSTFERYKELWGLEIIGNIYENPELLEE